MPAPRKYHILEIVQSLEKGGRTTRFSDTVSALRVHEHKVLPAVFGEPAPWVSIDGLQKLDRAKSKLGIIRELCALITENNIDLVHAHCEFTQLYAGLAAKCCGVPLVSTFHRSELSKYKPSISNKLIRWASGACVAVSENRMRLLTKNMGIASNKCYVVHGGTPVDDLPDTQMRSNAKQSLDLDARFCHLLSVGHLGPIKGHQDTLEAIASLPENVRTSLRLHIAGSGSEQEQAAITSKVEALGLQQEVSLLGQITNVSDWMTACDLFILPSHEEAFGLVFIEAGAKGLATIATRVGGIPDIIEHQETGLLVPPKTPSALSDAIRQLTENADLRQTMGQKAHKRVASRFSTDNMINQYLAIFNRVSS
ncbi:glycosyltransferase family 4 protein [Alteromonas halophila]|nr:glycosyltransferase family 4 protein [Alteromonas halophila]